MILQILIKFVNSIILRILIKFVNSTHNFDENSMNNVNILAVFGLFFPIFSNFQRLAVNNLFIKSSQPQNKV